MAYVVPDLPYDYNALEPHIDEETMKIHHNKHHKAYVDKLNTALEKHPELQNKPIEELIAGLHNLPEDVQTAVKNNGGGHANHSFFWQVLKKNQPPEGEVVEAIKRKWGDLEAFKEEFNSKTAGQFGSGWGWLVWNSEELEIVTTSNQDSPISSGKIPLFCVDVWEHAYYLKYQNKRPAYLSEIWNIVNWKKVNEHYLRARHA